MPVWAGNFSNGGGIWFADTCSIRGGNLTEAMEDAEALATPTLERAKSDGTRDILDVF